MIVSVSQDKTLFRDQWKAAQVKEVKGFKTEKQGEDKVSGTEAILCCHKFTLLDITQYTLNHVSVNRAYHTYVYIEISVPVCRSMDIYTSKHIGAYMYHYINTYTYAYTYAYVCLHLYLVLHCYL